MTEAFAPGAEVVVRYVVRGHVWSAVPWTVIEDGPRRLKMALAPGSRWMCPVGIDAQTHIRAQASPPWTFEERTWNGWCVSISPRGAGHAFESYGVGDEFHGWKIQLEAPKRRTQIGFDTTDHYLDVRIEPDRTWRWDDEDEMALAIELGIFTPDAAEGARREGELALDALARNDPLFDELRVPPTGVRPTRVPDGWDAVPVA
jgi:hypothetical protein